MYDNRLRNFMVTLLCLVIVVVLAIFGWNQFFGPKSRRIVTNANEVVFVIDLHPNSDNSTQVPTVSTDAKFYENKKSDTREVTIEQYCYQPKGAASGCENRDRYFVIAVDTTPVNTTWIAPAILEGQPMPDMSGAFSMQSQDSTGVYIGAQLVVRVSPIPAEAAKYVAKYAYADQPDSRTVHMAKSLTDVVTNEFRPLIQSTFSLEFVQWDAIPVNSHLADIIKNTRTTLNAYAAERGIEIISFGFRDGVVYENPAIQKALDTKFDLENQAKIAQADKDRQDITNAANVARAKAEAEAKKIAAQGDADAYTITAEAKVLAQTKYAELLKNNPLLITLEWINKWNGQVSIVSSTNQSNIPVLP